MHPEAASQADQRKEAASFWRRWAPDPISLLSGIGLLAVFVLSRSTWHIHTTCLWRSTFGTPCPGCGLTRALVAIARGRFALAWEMHPWAYVLLPALIWLTVVPYVAKLAGIPRPSPESPSRSRQQARMWGLFVVLTVFTGWYWMRMFRG